MNKAERAYELQERINRSIAAYGECTHSDADELEKICDSMTEEEADRFIQLCEGKA